MPNTLPPAILAERLAIVKYVNAGSVAILIFDYLLTLELEIKYMWRYQWGPATVLFILSRYSPVFDVPVVLYYSFVRDISPKNCNNLHTIFSWGNTFGIAIAEAILALRTYALSGRKRRVLLVISALYVSGIIATIATLSIFTRSTLYIPPPLNVPGCYLATGNFKVAAVSYAVALLNDVGLVAYTAWLGFKKYRDTNSPVLATLYRDGITYFIFLLGVSLVNIAVLIAGPTGMSGLLNLFVRVMHSVLSARVILQVRRTADKQPDMALNLGTMPLQGSREEEPS